MENSPSLTNGKTSQCSRCKRFFASDGFLRRHIRVAHGDRFLNEPKAPASATSRQRSGSMSGHDL